MGKRYIRRKEQAAMNLPERYQEDIFFFFNEKPKELALYQALEQAVEKRLPQAEVRVQKSQISFYGKYLFAAASLPVRRRKGCPEQCLVVTVGLPRKVDSPRVAVAVEPYPGRWTHHILITCPEEVDSQLMEWIEEAWNFAQTKGGGRRKQD